MNIIRKKIISCRSVGKRQMYDLEVNHPDHNFVLSSGIITSNSHAFSYSAVSGAEFWLKHNYFVEYIASIINNASTSPKKKGEKSPVVKYVNYAIKRGIEIVPPSINESGCNVKIKDDKIYFALSHIKYLGKVAEIIEKKQPYTDFDDFYNRVPKNRVNKRVVENLIATGAFDEFSTDKNELLRYYVERRNEGKTKSQIEELPNPISNKKWVEKEMEVLGTCLSKKSLVIIHSKLINENKWFTIGNLNGIEKTVHVFGKIEKTTKKTSKTGNPYLLVEMSDGLDNIDFFVWKGDIPFFNKEINVDNIIAVPLAKFDDSDGRFFESNKDIIIIERAK